MSESSVFSCDLNNHFLEVCRPMTVFLVQSLVQQAYCVACEVGFLDGTGCMTSVHYEPTLMHSSAVLSSELL